MTVNIHTIAVTAVIACDTPGCDRTIRHANPVPNVWDARRDINEAAQRAGWSCWNGRSRRNYCPYHSPKPGHKMWLVYEPGANQ